MFKYIRLSDIREHIFVILTTTLLFFCSFSKSFSEENIFIVDNIQIKGTVDSNFTRDKYIDEAFENSFEILMNKILIYDDLNKVDNIELKKIKGLVDSFQILEENYSKSEYFVSFKFLFNPKKVKSFLEKKNISFSQPKKISVIFFPVLFINDEIQNFEENYFYDNWNKNEIKNELINFILPLENLDDFLKIKETNNKIEDLNPKDFVDKYDIKNYAFALIEFNNNKLNVHLKADFDKNPIKKNIVYDLNSFENTEKLNSILLDLKEEINDLWKEMNLVNLLMPLSIRVKFQYKNLADLDKLKDSLNKLGIIDSYDLEEIDKDNSFFKIYYYGNPKKLRTELSKFKYRLKDDKGYWEIYINE